MNAAIASTSETGPPLNDFTGTITPQPVSLLYKIGLAVVAFAMVLLPAVYGLLIVLAAWSVVWVLKNDSSDGRSNSSLVFYLVPVSAILIFFMLKPLFAKRPKRVPLPSLDPAKEPLLFEFVQRICEQVRAPMPCRIDLDCQVNASASLRRGFWSRDLVLTIGLPLVAGMDMREFGGVLAHEFGHFAQGAGMRLTYIIRQINFWFARVVFERDQWDQHLERWSKRLDIRLSIVLYVARFCVWLTRRVLWLLMHAGNGISCFMMRQMEYDADSYETKLAGSGAFESTARRLRELNAASQIAVEEVRQSWASRRLPENLPLLIQHKAVSLPDELRSKLDEALTSKKTGWFDTHPCDADRIRASRAMSEPGVFATHPSDDKRVRAARAMAEPGVFLASQPATELFANFAETSKAITRFVYQKNWKLEFTEQNLVVSGEMLAESAANTEADAAIHKFYGKVDATLMQLLVAGQFPPLLDRDSAIAQWREARGQTDRLRAQAEKASEECQTQRQRLIQMMVAWNLSRAGFKLQPKAFGLPDNARNVIDQEVAARFGVEEASETIRKQMQALGTFIAALRGRITLALQLTEPSPGEELQNLLKTLAAVGKTLPHLHQIGIRLQPLTVISKNSGNHNNPSQVGSNMSRLAGELRKSVADAQSFLDGLEYPFPHPKGRVSVLEYAQFEKAGQNQIDAAFQQGKSHLERLFALHHRLLGQLLVLVDKAEKGLEG